MQQFKIIIAITMISLLTPSVWALPENNIGIDQKIKNFGLVEQGQTVRLTYTITNNSDQPATIERIIPDCDCTIAPEGPITIRPNASYLLKVTYQTGVQTPGNKLKALSVHLNSGVFNLYFKGTILSNRERTSPETSRIQSVSITSGQKSILESPRTLPKQSFTDKSAGSRNQPGPKTNKKTIQLHYFYADDCTRCDKIADNIIKPLPKTYGAQLVIHYHELKNIKDYEQFLVFQKKLGFKIKKFPIVILGNQSFQGTEIQLLLQKHLEKSLTNIEPEATPTIIRSKDNAGIIQEWFKTFSYWSIISSGLIDGLNPCAFSTLLFFVAFLTAGKYEKKQIITIGVTFLLVSFLTYLMIGFGLFHFIRRLSLIKPVNLTLLALSALFTLLLSVLHIRDYLAINRNNDLKNQWMQLSAKAKRRIHERIRKNFGLNEEPKSSLAPLKLFFITSVASFLITLTESVCTGQMYVPALVIIAKTASSNIKAFLLLLLYNLAFIAPLGVVLLLSLIFINLKAVSRFQLNRIKETRLITAGFFLLLSFSILCIMFFEF